MIATPGRAESHRTGPQANLIGSPACCSFSRRDAPGRSFGPPLTSQIALSRRAFKSGAEQYFARSGDFGPPV